MPWELRIDGFVKKQLKKLPRQDAGRIFSIIQSLVTNPYAGDIEKMQGERDTWRRRVGVYRIIYEIDVKKKIIIVADVRRRTSKTY